MRPPPEMGGRRWPKHARHTSQMDRLRMRGEDLAVAAPARPSGRDGVMASLKLRPARKRGGGSSVHISPKTRPATAAAISTHPAIIEAPSRSRDPQSNRSPKSSSSVVLASIDLRSRHGRLVSARASASLRKGVLGSCNRAASQAAGRAY